MWRAGLYSSLLFDVVEYEVLLSRWRYCLIAFGDACIAPVPGAREKCSDRQQYAEFLRYDSNLPDLHAQILYTTKLGIMA